MNKFRLDTDEILAKALALAKAYDLFQQEKKNPTEGLKLAFAAIGLGKARDDLFKTADRENKLSEIENWAEKQFAPKNLAAALNILVVKIAKENGLEVPDPKKPIFSQMETYPSH